MGVGIVPFTRALRRATGAVPCGAWRQCEFSHSHSVLLFIPFQRAHVSEVALGRGPHARGGVL